MRRGRWGTRAQGRADEEVRTGSDRKEEVKEKGRCWWVRRRERGAKYTRENREVKRREENKKGGQRKSGGEKRKTAPKKKEERKEIHLDFKAAKQTSVRNMKVRRGAHLKRPPLV